MKENMQCLSFWPRLPLSITSSLVLSIYLGSSCVLFFCNRRLEFQAEYEPIA